MAASSTDFFFLGVRRDWNTKSRQECTRESWWLIFLFFFASARGTGNEAVRGYSRASLFQESVHLVWTQREKRWTKKLEGSPVRASERKPVGKPWDFVFSWANLAKSRSGIPKYGIQSDWSMVTGQDFAIPVQLTLVKGIFPACALSSCR